MLNNPNWDKTLPPRDLFKAWLETKDPTQSFYYNDKRECAVGQFLQEVYKTIEWRTTAEQLDRISYRAFRLACAQNRDPTFGDVLEEIRKEEIPEPTS